MAFNLKKDEARKILPEMPVCVPGAVHIPIDHSLYDTGALEKPRLGYAYKGGGELAGQESEMYVPPDTKRILFVNRPAIGPSTPAHVDWSVGGVQIEDEGHGVYRRPAFGGERVLNLPQTPRQMYVYNDAEPYVQPQLVELPKPGIFEAKPKSVLPDTKAKLASMHMVPLPPTPVPVVRDRFVPDDPNIWQRPTLAPPPKGLVSAQTRQINVPKGDDFFQRNLYQN